RQPLHATVANILAHWNNPHPPAIWAPGASGVGFPEFARQNAIDILGRSVVPRLWVGNAVTAPTHYDMSDGVACVATGRRRFTFFPPDQLLNLYVGPLDLSPGGVPTSMVKVSAPDLERYPNFAKALAAAETAELEAGDAVFIPNYWWHNVDSLDPLNLLVNYWWVDYSRGPASPFAALALGLLSITALPPSRRELWRKMFDHYVFQTDGDPVPYLPPDRRGMLGPMNPRLENYMRTQVVRSITKSLPKPLREQIQRWMESAAPSVDSEMPYGND
ncbi:MAG: cupin-like domain-containing protein, partial [Terriglobales bacterium]